MAPKSSESAQADGQAVSSPFVFNAAVIARIHTCLAYAAFITALVVGCLCHYKKIVKNSVAGYPQEWFPSVSATIGDWYPERNLFQILIAMTAGPRFALVIFQYYLHQQTRPALPVMTFTFGIIRTLSCGGWVYITSSDDHDVHDIFMITYIVCNIPWMFGCNACTTPGSTLKRKRTIVSTLFFATLIPLIYFFLQHKVHKIPGAYTHYAFFEWSLILLDVAYDSFTEQELIAADLQISFGRPSDVTKMQQTTPVSKIAAAVPLDDNSTSVNNETRKRTTLNLSLLSPNFRSTFSFVSDVYLSYVFWSIFTSLIPTLFYFSVWELGIAGHELALLSTLSPLLLGITPLLHWARTRAGQATLHVLELIGLAAFILESPGLRLLAVAPATAVLVLRQAAEWSSEEEEPGKHGIILGLGVSVSSLMKHWNYSNNPIWPFVNRQQTFYNKLGFALALFAIYESYSRPSSKPTPKSNSHGMSSHWITAALPLGSLLFTLHNLISDSSTLVAWSWTGFENGLPKGPVPHFHSALTLVVQCCGLLIPAVLPPTLGFDLLTHPIWFACGSICVYILYAYRNWIGYIGGLGFAFVIMSIIPSVLKRAELVGKKNVAQTYGTALAVYCLLNLASVLTVAYAFVPGGQYLRERTDVVLFAQMACLSLVFRRPQSSYSDTPRSDHASSKSTSSLSKGLLAVISVLSVLGTLYRCPSPPRPFKSGPRVFNAGIWTLHFGIDNEGRDSQEGVTNLLRDMQLDVVGLLETDLHRTSFGHRDLTRVAVEELGYYVDVGPGPNSHTWGAALLSKFPIINSTHHLLPSPRGELAPAIEAVLDVHGTAVTVIVSHNGQEEDPLDRELQSKELARIMASSYPQPVVFLGYVVTKPHAERPSPYKILVEDGRMYDIDKDDEDRWCEYILYRSLYRTSYARVSRGTITDTELQIGQFTLPKHGMSILNDTLEARYIRSFKEILPEHHWFPLAYYGNEHHGGVNGHYYHVFGTPLYYNLPENAIL